MNTLSSINFAGSFCSKPQSSSSLSEEDGNAKQSSCPVIAASKDIFQWQSCLAPHTPDRPEPLKKGYFHTPEPGRPIRSTRKNDRYEPYPSPSKAKREALQQKLPQTQEFCQDTLNPFA